MMCVRPETLKVKNLCLESVLCSVDRKDLTRLFIHNCNPYRVSYARVPSVRIGALSKLTNVSFSRPYDDAVHAEKVRKTLPAYLAEIEYPGIRGELAAMFMQLHSRGATLVEHLISLKPGKAPIYIPAYRFLHSKR